MGAECGTKWGALLFVISHYNASGDHKLDEICRVPRSASLDTRHC